MRGHLPGRPGGNGGDVRRGEGEADMAAQPDRRCSAVSGARPWLRSMGGDRLKQRHGLEQREAIGCGEEPPDHRMIRAPTRGGKTNHGPPWRFRTLAAAAARRSSWVKLLTAA